MAWKEAAELYERVLRPLLQQTGVVEVQGQGATASLQAEAREVFSTHVGGTTIVQLSQQRLEQQQLVAALWSPP